MGRDLCRDGLVYGLDTFWSFGGRRLLRRGGEGA